LLQVCYLSVPQWMLAEMANAADEGGDA